MKISLLLMMVLIAASNAIDWQGNWAQNCDFYGNDISSVKVSSELCGQRCSETQGCTHFAWSSYNGGTCWMKKGNICKSQATWSQGTVCGVIRESCGDPNVSGSTFNSDRTILSTRHGATEVGACSLPKADYSIRFPVALGDIPALGNLKFTPDLCGHILTINCGHGDLDIIINNSNLGGGLDLYASTWNKATSNLPPGETKCSARLKSKSIFNFDGYRCYHSTGETNNQWYRNVGLLNTKERIVTGASFNGKMGAHRGSNPYFAFDGFGTGDQKVTFYFADGGRHEVLLKDCLNGSEKQIWQ